MKQLPDHDERGWRYLTHDGKALHDPNNWRIFENQHARLVWHVGMTYDSMTYHIYLSGTHPRTRYRRCGIGIHEIVRQGGYYELTAETDACRIKKIIKAVISSPEFQESDFRKNDNEGG